MSAVITPEGPDVGAVWHYGDPLGEQHDAARAAVVVERFRRAVLTVTGDERRSWLHTISSQHVADAADGSVTENLNLDGQGRVQDHWVQTELGGVTYLDTEPARGEPLSAFLRAMIFWAKVQVDDADLGMLTVLGPQAGPALAALGVAEPPAAGTATALPHGDLGRPVPGGAPGGQLPGGGLVRRMPGATDEYDLLVPAAALADVADRLAAAGARRAGVWAYEAHRVAALRPRLGVDTDERTIPQEANWIDTAVHLDKGCYRGQETVARVHNLGRPPRMLVLLHLDGDGEAPGTADPVTAGGRPVGRLGTVVDHADHGRIALALVKRGLPAETPLLTAGLHPTAARIDPDSLPPADGVGAGRAAQQRLRGLN